VIDGADRVVEFFAVDHAQLVVGAGQFRIGGQRRLVIGNRALGILVVEILPGLLVIRIAVGIGLGGILVGRLIATNESQRCPKHEEKARRHVTNSNKASTSCKINGLRHSFHRVQLSFPLRNVA
jgi:hypothetical protein